MLIAALQMQAHCGKPDANLARIAAAARDAAQEGAKLLIVPELALPGYGAGQAMEGLGDGPDGPQLTELSRIANGSGVAIIAGFAERADGALFNSAVFTDGAGNAAIYRKTCLYGEYERSLFKPGESDSIIVSHGGLKIGLLICYDVEFPENVRRLALAGADLIAVPTALPESDHAALIARSMIPVRAFENQVFVAYVNHCGTDARFRYAGLSAIAAPDGKLLAAADDGGEALLIAEVNPAHYLVSRNENPYLLDLPRS